MARLESEISIETIISILKFVEEMGIESSSKFSFIASHFYEISTSDVSELVLTIYDEFWDVQN
jgi:hypothetical protein